MREIHQALIASAKIIGIEPGTYDAFTHVVAVHSGEQIAIDDVGSRLCKQRRLVFFARMSFLAGNKACADVGKIGTHGLRGENRIARHD